MEHDMNINVLDHAAFINKLAFKINKEHYEELFQVGMLALVEASNRYDLEKGAFLSYAGTCARGKMLEYMSRNIMKYNNECEYEEGEYSLSALDYADKIHNEQLLENIQKFIDNQPQHVIN